MEDYSQLYSMNQAQVGHARLFVSGDYVALLILGQMPEEELTADAESQWFRGEGGKVDAAWKDIFWASTVAAPICRDVSKMCLRHIFSLRPQRLCREDAGYRRTDILTWP